MALSEFFTLGTIVGSGGYIIAGVLVVLGMFGMGARDRRSESDKVASDLINNLKLTVEQLEKANVAMTARLDQTTKELHLMQGRNEMLERLFNGAEGSILSFLKQAPSLVEMIKDNNALSHQNNAALTTLTDTMEKFLNKLSEVKS